MYFAQEKEHRISDFFTDRKETRAELLMSIMTIYIYSVGKFKKLKELPGDRTHFSDFLYQPEKDDDTNKHIFHHEDHNHMLKRLVNWLREGLIRALIFITSELHYTIQKPD